MRLSRLTLAVPTALLLQLGLVSGTLRPTENPLTELEGVLESLSGSGSAPVPAPGTTVAPAPAPLAQQTLPPGCPAYTQGNGNGRLGTLKSNAFNAATWGQVFSTPDQDTCLSLSAFSFEIESTSFAAGMTLLPLLGQLYEFNTSNNQISGNLKASQQFNLAADDTALAVSFSSPIQLLPSQTYVALFTSSGLWSNGAASEINLQGYSPSSNGTIPGGYAVLLDSGNNLNLLSVVPFETKTMNFLATISFI